MATALPVLPPLHTQAELLIRLGVHELGGIAASDLRAAAATEAEGALFVIHPDRVPASALAPLLECGGKPGFVVVDMPDVDDFSPIDAAVPPPGADVYLIRNLDRGDHMANWSPDEALPAITAGARTPHTLVEGIHWLLQQPAALERNHCFMTIGSRLRKPNGALDARTPALWISNGTGRDGAKNRGAPKVGWCWAGNRHRWLGFASAASRTWLPHSAATASAVFGGVVQQSE